MVSFVNVVIIGSKINHTQPPNFPPFRVRVWTTVPGRKFSNLSREWQTRFAPLCAQLAPEKAGRSLQRKSRPLLWEIKCGNSRQRTVRATVRLNGRQPRTYRWKRVLRDGEPGIWRQPFFCLPGSAVARDETQEVERLIYSIMFIEMYISTKSHESAGGRNRWNRCHEVLVERLGLHEGATTS